MIIKMYFKEEEVTDMQIVFRRLDNKTIDSLQFYTPVNKYRTGCTQVVYNKWKKPIYIFQYFKNLSPYRMKLLMQLSEKIPYPIHINQSREDIQCIGWKIA